MRQRLTGILHCNSLRRHETALEQRGVALAGYPLWRCRRVIQLSRN